MSTDTQYTPDFKFETPKCPHCGGDAAGVTECLYAVASLISVDGGYVYEGGSRMVYDSQETDFNDRGMVDLHCGDCRGNWESRVLH